MLKPRSKLLFISGIWTLIYALMLRPTPEEIEGIHAILVVIIVWQDSYYFKLFAMPCLKSIKTIEFMFY